MATRRPRVKAAAILTARRPPSASVASATAVKTDTDERKITIASIIENPKNDKKSPINQFVDEAATVAKEANENTATTTEITTSNHAEPTNFNNGFNGNADAAKDVEPISRDADGISSATAGPVPKPFRRILTPAVNIPNRRRPPNAAGLAKTALEIVKPSQAASSPARCQEFAAIRSPSPTKADEKPVLGVVKGEGQTTEMSVISSIDVKDGSGAVPSPAKGGISQRRGTIDNDECFKSPPFMSPSMQYGRRPDPSSSPFTDAYSDDYAKSPASIGSNKIRPRIRPTPSFMVRRNSIQSQSEMDEETNRRQRHYSTSSMQGAYTPVHSPFPQRNAYVPNRNGSRNRTESVSSNMSDVFSTRDYASKQKRSMRSEECQRVANAKREFNQRLNGNPPDKTRLTMYDLIYYNPSTNPMKKPAVKTERRDGDSVSVTSVRTIDSRNSSVKTESSVKSESAESETNMPVPQLKLGPNGEIILDEKSLVIETTGDKEARAMLANSDVVYDDEFSGTSGFYKRHKRTKDWPPEETIKFYRALQTIGTDFSVMLELFPNRTRRDLKLKFKKEERQNMALVNKALLHPKQFNIEMLKEQFEEEDRQTLAKQEEWKEAKQRMMAEKKKQLTAARKRDPRRSLPSAARNLLDGDAAYEAEFAKMPRTSRRRRRDIEIENGSESPMITPVYLSITKTPLRPSQTESIFSNPTTPLAMHSPKLPSFSEMMSSSHKSVIQQLNNNNNNQQEEIKQHVYAKHPLGYSIPDDGPPPVTYSIPTPVAERHDDMSPIAVPAQPLLNGTVLDHYIKNDNMTVKVDSEDIMNMDIIFEDAPIVEDTSIGRNAAVEVHATESFTPDASSTIFIIRNISEVEEAVMNDVTVVTSANEAEALAGGDVINTDGHAIPIVREEHFDAGIIAEESAPSEHGMASNIVKIEQNNQALEVDVESRADEREAAEKKEATPTTAALPRKRKPPPVLVGRDGKVQRRGAAPATASKPMVHKSGTKEVHLSAFSPPESIPNFDASSPEPVSTRRTSVCTSASIDEPIPSSSPPVNAVSIKVQSPLADNEDDTAEPSDNLMNSLVVVESQDPLNPDRIIHEVYVMCPKTKELSEQPLDLPDDVIQRIRSTMQ